MIGWAALHRKCSPADVVTLFLILPNKRTTVLSPTGMPARMALLEIAGCVPYIGALCGMIAILVMRRPTDKKAEYGPQLYRPLYQIPLIRTRGPIGAVRWT